MTRRFWLNLVVNLRLHSSHFNFETQHEVSDSYESVDSYELVDSLSEAYSVEIGLEAMMERNSGGEINLYVDFHSGYSL